MSIVEGANICAKFVCIERNESTILRHIKNERNENYEESISSCRYAK